MPKRTSSKSLMRSRWRDLLDFRRYVFFEDFLPCSVTKTNRVPAHKLSDAIAPTIIDFGLLAIYTLTAFAGAFVVFLRYDVR